MEILKCNFCDKECKNKMSQTKHQQFCKSNPNRLTVNPKFKGVGGKKVAWNKGLTKDTDERVTKFANTFKERVKAGLIIPSFTGRKHTKETKEKISKKLSINNKGGRCKWYKVKNLSGEEFNVQGTWEREFSKYLNTIDSNWIKIGIGKKGHTFKWLDDDSKLHHYSPDFYSPKFKKYFEVKGFWWGNDKDKMKKVLEQNSINIEIIDKDKYYNLIKSTN